MQSRLERILATNDKRPPIMTNHHRSLDEVLAALSNNRARRRIDNALFFMYFIAWPSLGFIFYLYLAR